MKLLTSLIFLFCCLSLLSAQENETESLTPSDKKSKNIVYTNAEYYLLGGAVAISYERFIYAARKFDFSLRGTYGRWAFGGGLGEDGPSYGNLFKLTGNMLFLEGNNHLEIDVGAMMLINDEKSGIQSIVPDLFLGYTYKKPEGGLVFKAGIGVLGFLSVGLGYAF